MAATGAVATAPTSTERLARAAERVLRSFGDARTGLVLLVATGVANAVAAAVPDGPRLLDGAWYAILLGALALSGLAAVAMRAPAAWREWRRPGAVQPGSGALEARIAARGPEELVERLQVLGYRARIERARGRWSVHAVRRGASRFAGLASHVAVVVVVLGAAMGSAFGSETRFTLLPGDQALLDAPRAGFSSAVRLESLDAEFAPDGRPLRLDTNVTFLQNGEPVRADTLRVNEPGDHGGYLVHAWTYGPAARLRITDLGGAALLDAAVPLADERDGTPVGAAELPTAGATVGLALTDSAANELGVSVVGRDGVVDRARLRPGDEVRVGNLHIAHGGFDEWVTFLSRRDPGAPVLFGGAALLAASLAIGFWLPRRRLTIRPVHGELRLVLRGERFDRPGDELDRLRADLGTR